MYVEYKRDVSHNYLILTEEKQINTSSYQVRMLEGNVIPSVLRCRLQGLDGKVLLYYDITSRQSVASFYEQKKINGEDLKLIFGGFVTVLEGLSEYLMNPEQLVLAPEYIYLDAGKKEIKFCCLPGYAHPVQEQFRELAEYFLPRLDHEDSDAVKLGYGVYRKTLETGFQLEDIKEAVYRQEKEEPTGEFFQKNQEKSYSEEGIGQEDFLSEDQSPDRYYFQEENKKEVDKQNKKTKWSNCRWILGCGLGTLILILVAVACLMGYLPVVEAELVLAVAILLLAIAAVSRWMKEKKKKKQQQSEQWQQKVRKELQKKGEKSVVLYQNQEAQSMDFGESSLGISKGKEQEMVDNQKCFTGELWKNEEKVWNDEKMRDRENLEDSWGETVLLSQGATKGPASLVSMEPGALATIYLDQELTVVGKMEQAADAVIPVDTVSRVHARIRKKDDGYYLADLNSRNGTSVNGRMLKPEEEYLLQNEDQVDFAKARYLFLK